MIAVDMSIDTDQNRDQRVLNRGHQDLRDQALRIDQEEEEIEEIDSKMAVIKWWLGVKLYVYNLYLKFCII